MKRLLQIFLILLVALGGVIAAVIWLIQTPQGMHTLFAIFSAVTPYEIKAHKISGSITDELKLEGIRVQWPQGALKAEVFHLRWQTLEVWEGKGMLEKAVLKNLTILDRRPPSREPPEFHFPRAGFWLTRLDLGVKKFIIQDLTYRRGEQDPVKIEKISGGILWRKGMLAVRDFHFDSAWGLLEGSGKIGLYHPSLDLDLRVNLSKALGPIDSLTVATALETAKGPMALQGPVSILGRGKSGPRLRVQGTVGLGENRIRLREFQIWQAGHEKNMKADGEIVFSKRPPLLIRMAFSGLDLERETGMPTDFSGAVEMSGAYDLYRGHIQLINHGEGWKALKISTDVRGNLKKAEFQRLRIDWLEGFLQGGLNVSWDQGLALEGKIQCRDLNPGAFDPRFPGKINIDLQGRYLSPKKNLHRGTLTAHILKSRLQGKEFEGALEAAQDEDLLRLSRFELKGQAFDLRANGVLQERVKVLAQIRDLSAFVPNLKGQVQGTGWVRYHEKALRAELELQGKDLDSDKVRVGAWESRMSLELAPEKKEPRLDAVGRFQRISSGALFIDSVAMRVKGTLSDHGAEISLQWPKAKISVSFSGSYRDGAWNGILRKLEGKEPSGIWKLQEPTKISASPGLLKIPSLRIAGQGAEALRLSLDLALNPIGGSLEANWRQLDLSHANVWLRREKLAGRADGKLKVRLEKEQTRVSGGVKIRGTYSRDSFRIEVFSAQFRGDWDKGGLQASLSLHLAGKGMLKADLSSPEPVEMKAPEKGDFLISWSSLDLALLKPLIPSSFALKGDLSGSVKGTWGAGLVFGATGAFQVSQGAFSWEREEGRMRAALERAEASFSWREKTLKGTLSLALLEYGWLKADFQLPLEAKIQPIMNPEGPLRINLEGKFHDAGLLSSIFPANIRESRGEAELNLHSQGTWAKPSLQGAVSINSVGIQFILPKDEKTGEEKRLPARRDVFEFEMPSGRAEGMWGDKGLQANVSIDLQGKGKIRADFSSPDPGRPALPERGKMKIAWESLDLSLLNPLLPPSLDVRGFLSGFIKGQWLPGWAFDMIGEAGVSQGEVTWKRESGLVGTRLEKAEASFAWREKTLNGKLSVALSDYGWLKGDFRLPVEARIPPAVHPDGSLWAVLQGRIEEMGLLPAIFPGVVQKTRGKLELDGRAAGTWQSPELKGSLKLSQAGVVIPPLGIHLKDLSAHIQLLGEKIIIESLAAQSGPGRIEGKGTVWLEGWRLKQYEGRLEGERFQAVYLPEVRALVNPRLDFKGTTEKLQVRGEIHVPQLLIHGKPTKNVLRPSADVVIVDKAHRKKFPLGLDIQVRIVLGDRVLVNAYGLDARLSGDLDVRIGKPEETQARGEIKVEKGHYSVYGVKLEITRGRFLFAGVPLTQPALDILALRKVKEVEAGVIVSGDAQKPVIQLYSRPAMADTDVLSYIILGRPFSGSDPKDINLLLTAAGVLLSQAESVSLQDKMKSLVGLDTLDIVSGSGDLSRSMVTVGKYLTPDVYVSLGYAVFSKTQDITMRATIIRHWEVESTWGAAGGVDLYYKIEFQ